MADAHATALSASLRMAGDCVRETIAVSRTGPEGRALTHSDAAAGSICIHAVTRLEAAADWAEEFVRPLIHAAAA